MSDHGGEKERPLHELLSRDMVDIYVGPENTHWVLHEKLLCHRSSFFRNVFYNVKGHRKSSVYGLPDEDDEPFKMFIGWLYSERVPPPEDEKDLAPLLDLYLMAEKWEIRRLMEEVLDAVRRHYHETDSWPSLRRVQYIYASTSPDSPMRRLLVSCVARMLVLGSVGVPAHWENALRNNGRLAVDIIVCVQAWQVEPGAVPDAREESLRPTARAAEKNGMVVMDDDDDDDSDPDNTLDWGEGLTWSGIQSRANSEAEAFSAVTNGR